MANGLDCDLELQARTGTRVFASDRGERDHSLQRRRPRRGCSFANLHSFFEHRHSDTRCHRGNRRWQTDCFVETLNLRPVDLESNNLARVADRIESAYQSVTYHLVSATGEPADERVNRFQHRRPQRVLDPLLAALVRVGVLNAREGRRALK